MKNILILLFICLCVSCGTGSGEKLQSADLIISGATVIDPSSEQAPQIEDIAVKDGKILAIGPDLASQFEAEITYDAKGRFIIPGLADMHSHFGNGILPPGEDDTTQVLARHLYFGNTTILNLGSSYAWPSKIDELRNDIQAGKIAGPRILAAGALITLPGSHPVSTIYGNELQAKIAEIAKEHEGDGPIDLAPLRATTLVKNADDIKQEVKRLGDQGADAIKLIVESGPPGFGDVHPQMTPEMIRAAADAAKPYGIPVICHVSSTDEIESCMDNGGKAAAHAAVDMSQDLPPDLEKRMKEAGFFLIPTAAMFEGWYRYPSDLSLLDRPLMKPVLSEAELGMLKSPGLAKGVGLDEEFAKPLLARLSGHLKKLNDVGGMIVAGTDTGNPYRIAGFALHEEMAFYVRSGLSPIDALRTATANSAKAVGAEDEWGSLKPGLAADLVLLEKDPLADINNTLSIVEVIKAGKAVDRKALTLR